jgi:hypothetical protein
MQNRFRQLLVKQR